MNIWQLGRKKKSCALDLGQRWIKVVRLISKKNKLHLNRMGRMFLESDGPKAKENKELGLRNLCSSLLLQDKSMISSMAGPNVIIKNLDLPLNSKSKDMEQAFLDQAQEYIPFDMQDVYLDFQILGPGQQEGTQNIILVASKKEMVRDLQNILAAAGLQAAIIDVDGFALSNCFEFNYPERKQEINYLLDIGHGHSVFCVYAQGGPIFVRDLDLGAQQLIESLASTLEMTLLEAEKTQLTMPQDLHPTRQAHMAREKDKIFLKWGSEIQRLIDFYQSSAQKKSAAENLFLAGGGSLIPGLKSSLTNILELQVHHIDPLRALVWDNNSFDSVYLQSVAPQFAVAVGLALRRVT